MGLATVFQSFNPEMRSFFLVRPVLFWGALFLPLLLTKPSLWVQPSRLTTLKRVILRPILSLVKNQRRRGTPLVPSLLASLFLFLVAVNLRGLIPYVFPYTRQLYVTLTHYDFLVPPFLYVTEGVS